MHIHFKQISWRNFLSTGNNKTTVSLDKYTTRLIVGENGAGKSTLLDAITFAIYNKPFRKVNKPQLINSINKKDCVVEVEFVIGTTEYLVRRGMKPNIFEIYKNGELINQDAASRDYQEMLEKYILKLNYKAFCQVVIVGSASNFSASSSVMRSFFMKSRTVVSCFSSSQAPETISSSTYTDLGS